MNEQTEQKDQNQTPSQALPTGYSKLVPFTRDGYLGMGRSARASAEFVAGLNSILVLAPEFFAAARSYPIVFGKDGSGRLLPLAITGLAERENLFVDGQGRWLGDTYIPAYVRRWPFFVAAVRTDSPQAVICVDPAGLEESEMPFIDKNGEQTPLWQDTERMINEMEAARGVTKEFVETIAELDLVEPFEAHAVPNQGARMRLANMLRVSEERLNKLPEKKIKALMNKGYLSRIYAHIISLENFQRLLDLKAQRERLKAAN